MQPYFFPYIGYFQLINSVDIFVIYDDVNYIKGGWINRNRILINGKDHFFTLSLSRSSSYKSIKDITIIDNSDNKVKLFNTLRINYSRAPYYKKVLPMLQRIILNPEISLSTYLENSLKDISGYLGIKTRFILSSEIPIKKEYGSEKRVIEIVKILNGEIYINAINGQKLYSKDRFLKEELKLLFIEQKGIKYKQLKNTFIPNLSIIDVLMFNSKNKVKKILNEYKLV